MPDPTCPAGSERKAGTSDLYYVTPEDYAAAWGDLWPIILPFVPVSPWVAFATDDLCAEPPEGPFILTNQDVLDIIRKDWTAVLQLHDITLKRLQWHLWNTYCQCAAVTLPIGSACYNAQNIALNPYLYWKLTETAGTTAEDYGPNNHDGTYEGTYTLSSSGPFDEEGAHFGLPHGGVQAANLTIPSQYWTLAGWVRQEGYHTVPTNQHFIAMMTCFEHLTDPSQIYIYFQATNATTATLRAAVRYHSPASSNGLVGPSFPINEWHHVAVRHTAGLLSLYVDGALVASTAIADSGPLPSSTLGNIKVGSHWADSDPSNASMYGWYFGPVLTPEQITALYEAGVSECNIGGEPTPVDEMPAAEVPEGIPLPPASECDEAQLCVDITAIRNQLTMVREEVRTTQRQVAPFGYTLGQTFTGLTGTGTVAVRGTLGARVDVTTLPTAYGSILANPTILVDIGWIALGTADGVLPAQRVQHDQLLTIPPAAGIITAIYYNFRPGVVASITTLERLR